MILMISLLHHRHFLCTLNIVSMCFSCWFEDEKWLEMTDLFRDLVEIFLRRVLPIQNGLFAHFFASSCLNPYRFERKQGKRPFVAIGEPEILDERPASARDSLALAFSSSILLIVACFWCRFVDEETRDGSDDCSLPFGLHF